MRIALFHNAPSGGAKRAIYEWTRRLSEQHAIDAYTLSTADHAFCDIRPFVGKHRVVDFSPNELFHSPLGRLNQYQRWRDLGKLVQLGRQLAREIDADKYDVLFANVCRYTFIPSLLQFTRTPSVFYLHEPFGRRFYRTFQRPYLQDNRWRSAVDRVDPLISLYQRRLERMQQQSLVSTDRVLANSEFTREQMKRLFTIDSIPCPYGVDTESFYPLTGKRKENFVFSVGELSPRKGFDFLVKSLALVPAPIRPMLKLACNAIIPQEKAYLEGLAAEQGVTLEILTNQGVEQLRHYYNTARFCVYSPVAEPFGLVPLEAMACGAAVVGVREGGVQESVVHEQTGLLVEREPHLFATAIQHLLANPALADQYGRKGRQQVLQHWTWENSVAHLERQLCFDRKAETQ